MADCLAGAEKRLLQRFRAVERPLLFIVEGSVSFTVNTDGLPLKKRSGAGCVLFPAMNPESPEKHSLPPAWLRWFVSDASRGIIDDGSLPPIGCHYFFESEQRVWEVTLFVGRTEVVGGPRDGNTISSGLQVDVGRVMNAFDSPPECYWQSEAIHSDDQLGNHLSLEGAARGHHVWLRILHHAPDWTSVSRLMHSGQGVVEDLW